MPDYVLDDRGSISFKAEKFLVAPTSRPVMGPTQPIVDYPSGTGGRFPEIRGPRRVCHHANDLNLSYPIRLHGTVLSKYHGQLYLVT